MNTIEGKFDGEEYKLAVGKKNINCSNKYFSLEMNKKLNIKKSEPNKHESKNGKYSLRNFAIMYSLMKGIWG